MSRSRRPTFLTILDLADQLQVSDKTVRRWIKSGELVAHKLGDQYRISEADLELFFARAGWPTRLITVSNGDQYCPVVSRCWEVSGIHSPSNHSICFDIVFPKTAFGPTLSSRGRHCP